MAYEAIVTRISVRPHPNAERLQLGTCHGHQVVVGLDTKDGELGVFFPTDGQLSEEFILANELYSKDACSKLGLSYPEGHTYGFFSEKRRVRSQSFRGQKSDGFWVPASFFQAWGGIGTFKEGDTFDALFGTEICRKYFTPATLRAQGKNQVKRKENLLFPKHDVTKQFKFVSRSIPTDAVIYITEKLHGTSGRYGLVPDEVELPWWKRAVNWAVSSVFRAAPVYPTMEYRYLNGSKNVILEKSTGVGWYGTNEFRYKAIDGVTLHKGEILYFEIVGFVDTGKAIMEPQVVKDEVKSLKKTYGDIMIYKYGLEPPNCDIYVYRVTRVNEDGVVTELSWPQVVARCAELGVKTVPELRPPIVMWDFRENGSGLDSIVGELTEGSSTVDPTHIREGVVLRVESASGTDFIKNKSWTFGVLEGYIKDKEDYVDTEEAA